ncbi:MAG: hypothetical protein LM523_02030 [Candidatus Contendobacter sp.]|nr:hypothetical protein [Candidatus Contendobacter sp.]
MKTNLASVINLPLEAIRAVNAPTAHPTRYRPETDGTRPVAIAMPDLLIN